MKQIMRLTIVIFIIVISSSCSFKHVVSEDYSQYLVNNEGNYQLPHTDYVAEYVLTPNTVNHKYEFRAATVGYAHLWVVKFGEILEKTLQSKDVQNAFQQLSKARDEDTSGLMNIKYNLINYQFEGFEAQVELQITALKNGTIIFDETYYQTGISQGGKMFWGGPFGMKNAIQQSTKNALDKILAQSLNDMKLKIVSYQ
jgi:PBP1b-binding outer membrane lipoprotein LpoB